MDPSWIEKDEDVLFLQAVISAAHSPPHCELSAVASVFMILMQMGVGLGLEDKSDPKPALKGLTSRKLLSVGSGPSSTPAALWKRRPF